MYNRDLSDPRNVKFVSHGPPNFSDFLILKNNSENLKLLNFENLLFELDHKCNLSFTGSDFGAIWVENCGGVECGPK